MAMKYEFGNTVILALGGSIVNPDGINVPFLKEFKPFVEKISKGKKIVIVVGGGSTARQYQNAADAVVPISDEDKDWLGIHATRQNAHLLRTIFVSVANPELIDSREKVEKIKNADYPVAIASGWRPGWSTDYVALSVAHDYGVKEAVIAGKPDHVYTADPDKDSSAKPMKTVSWRKYRLLIPARWTPGLNSPVDPKGAELADELGLKAIIIKGTDLKNFGALLSGEDFEGTIIS